MGFAQEITILPKPIHNPSAFEEVQPLVFIL
jgi:hypothetical protein